MSWLRPDGLWLAPALLLALGVIVILSDGLGIQSRLSARLFDAYQRHSARPFADMRGMPVRVLELPLLDEDRLVEVTHVFSSQGVRMIVLTAPVESGPSPQSLSARLPPGSDAARAALPKFPEPGHELGAAIAETRTILPVILGKTGRAPRPKARFVYRGTRDPFGLVPRFDAASAPPDVLQTNAAGLAAANLDADQDGVVRRMPVAFRAGAVLLPGMAAEVLRVAQGGRDITLISDEHDPLSFLSGIGIAALETPNGRVPTDKRGQLSLRYSAGSSQRKLDPNMLATSPLNGAIVVVGLEGDTVKTPLGLASVANVVAESIEDIVGDSVLIRPSWAPIAEALLLLAFGAAMIFLLRLGPGWAAVLVTAAAAALGLGSWYLYVTQGLLADWATPLLFLILAFLGGAFVWLHNLQLTYAALRATFSDSLSGSAIARIARRPQLLKIDGEGRNVTYLVCRVHTGSFEDDAAGFTTRMQKILSPLMDQIRSQGGTLERQNADGFAAFWNAPLDDADHALHACEAANGIATAATQNADVPQNQGDCSPAPAISLGIATGPVIAGGFGGHYSVHGDVVVLAEQIQTLTRRYSSPIIVADGTRQLADRGFAFLEIGTIAAGAIDAPATLYALMGNAVMRTSPKFRALGVFHDHIFQAIRKQNWRMARELIAQCRRLSGANQPLYDLHLARIDYYEKNPPGENWDGAFRPILE